MALSCVAITDRPTVHHGRLRLPRKYPSISFASLGEPQTVVDDPDEIRGDEGPVEDAHQEKYCCTA
jgi:hypothetical protein